MSGFYPNSDHRRYSYPDPNNRSNCNSYGICSTNPNTDGDIWRLCPDTYGRKSAD
jgi:hypothetical protein